MRAGFKMFDKVYLINLDKRKDRLERCIDLFKKNNVDDIVERFPGIIPDLSEDIPFTRDTEKIKVGTHGCLLSHIEIIKEAKRKNLNSVLVLEDDVEFINIDKIDLSIEQLFKKDWSLFYLGTNLHIPLERADDNLLILKKGFATHAVAYHKNFYDHCINQFNQGIIRIIDVWLSEYGQENFPCFCSYPITAIQSNDYSDIHNAFADYSWMEKKFIEHTKNII